MLTARAKKEVAEVLSRSRTRFTYASVMSTIAVIVALAGGSFAYASHLRVRSSDIVDGQVKTQDLAKGSVRTPKIRKGAVTRGKLASALRGTTRFARVKSDGTLVDGTAVDAIKTGTGSYRLQFPRPVDKCAGAVSSASFAGFDSSVFRITGQLSIGFGEGGAADPDKVGVRLFRPSDGASDDSAFTLVLVCP
jgi:hypothetical protein